MTLPEPPVVRPAEPRPAASPPKRGRPPLAWVILALGIIFFLMGGAGGQAQGKLGEVQKNDNSSFLPGSADSTKVANEAEKFSDIQSIPGFVLYQRSGGLTAADKQKIAADVARFRQVKGVSADEVGAPQPGKSADVMVVSVPLIGKADGKSVQGDDLVTTEKDVLKVARNGAPSGLKVNSAGAGGLLVAFIDAFEGLDTTLLFSALVVVYVILLLVYRSPALPLIPLFGAGLALSVASLFIYQLAKHEVITLNGQSQGILSVLVVGAGTDYALLLISRYREHLHDFASPVDAMIEAWKGTVQPILASAVTVILGLICLSFAELNSTAGLGPVCAIGIAATVLVMLTVLPLMLLFFGRFVHWLWPVGWVLLALDFRRRRMVDGRWLFWPRRPRLDHETDILAVHGVWSRFARGISGSARRSWVGAAVVLIACVAAITTLKTDGLKTEDSFTKKPEALKGQQIYDRNFDKGAGAPAEILTSADKTDAIIAAAKRVPGVEPAKVCVRTDYSKVPAFVQANGPQALQTTGCPPAELQIRPVGGKIIVDAPMKYSYDSDAAYSTVKALRHAVGGVAGADAKVGGQSAVQIDVQDASRRDRNVIIPIVLAVILVVLALVLRALIAPLILIATVVLSFLASLGVSAIFFNHVFHFANADPGFPLFAFVFLVALGIDYNIFLMTRVREETLQYGTRQGVVRGLAVTGGVITSAGVVLAATFVVLGVVPIVFLAQVGFTVAFGVLLDTVVVRSILVPALSIDIGKKVWWPSKLAAAGARD